MIYVGLDLGSTTGWALKRNHLHSGRWKLGTGAVRWSRFQAHLADVLGPHVHSGDDEPVIVGYENVRRHTGTIAAHVYGGLLALLELWAYRNRVELVPLEVAAIKKRATGKGNATKGAMCDAARARWPQQNILDDNQADALWILQLLREQHGGVSPEPELPF